MSLTALCQSSNEVVGVVLDARGNPIGSGFVMVKRPTQKVYTDANGRFTLTNLPTDSVLLKVSYSGFETFQQRVKAGGELIQIVLKSSSVSLDEVKIHGHYDEQQKSASAQSIEIVNQEYLKQNQGGSIMSSLERLPGVSTISIGSGQSKPVIRGLGFNRVVVVDNNIKHEGQQWGADHGLEIDQYALDKVTVIKGPASLMYGSDAIGGVIDMQNKFVPEINTIGGAIDLTGKSNNGFLGTSVSLYARKKDFFITARATLADYGDFRVPTDSIDIYSFRVSLDNNQLRNSAGQERNLHTSFGVVRENFRSTFFVSNVNSEIGFFANAHGLEPRSVDYDLHDASSRDIQFPYQKVNHLKVINNSVFSSEGLRIESNFGYQRNDREEWSQYVQHGYMPPSAPENLEFNPELERQFTKNIFTGNTKISREVTDKMNLTAGLNGEYMINSISGRGFIIPSFSRLSLGSFAYGKYQLTTNSTLEAGIRFDYGSIFTERHTDWFRSPIDEDGNIDFLPRAENIPRNFNNFTWSTGYVYDNEKWNYKANVGKSFRMPIAKELAANGVNYHRFSYEVGDGDLDPEVSYQLDLAATYSSKKIAFGVSPFVSYFTNYIYLNPTANFSRLYGFGNQVFEYSQTEVLRYGGEFHGHYEPVDFLQLGFLGEYVFARQLSGAKKGFTLPFAPPATGIFSMKLHKEHLKGIQHPYVSMDYRLTARQENIVPPEVITPGYQVVDIRLGGDFLLREQEIKVALQVLNLFNTQYFNNTSFFRLLNIPEAGRNLIVNISIPISRKIKSI